MAKTVNIDKIYWDDVRKCWIDSRATEGLPLSAEQVEEILSFYTLEPLVQYFPADVLLKTPPDVLEVEKKLASVFTVAGEDDDDSLTYIFWDRRQNTWMVDVDPRDDNKHIPEPNPLSISFTEDLFRAFLKHDFVDYNDDPKLLELVLHMPPDLLKVFEYTP